MTAKDRLLSLRDFMVFALTPDLLPWLGYCRIDFKKTREDGAGEQIITKDGLRLSRNNKMVGAYIYPKMVENFKRRTL